MDRGSTRPAPNVMVKKRPARQPHLRTSAATPPASRATASSVGSSKSKQRFVATENFTSAANIPKSASPALWERELGTPSRYDTREEPAWSDNDGSPGYYEDGEEEDSDAEVQAQDLAAGFVERLKAAGSIPQLQGAGAKKAEALFAQFAAEVIRNGSSDDQVAYLEQPDTLVSQYSERRHRTLHEDPKRYYNPRYDSSLRRGAQTSSNSARSQRNVMPFGSHRNRESLHDDFNSRGSLGSSQQGDERNHIPRQLSESQISSKGSNHRRTINTSTSQMTINKDIDDERTRRHHAPAKRNASNNANVNTIIENLKTELAVLRLENEQLKAEAGIPEEKHPWKILYKIKCPDSHGWAVYSDEPLLVDNEWSSQRHKHWDARNRLSKDRLDRLVSNAGAFVVYREYHCSVSSNRDLYEQDSDDEVPLMPPRSYLDKGKYSMTNDEDANHVDSHTSIQESVSVFSESLRRDIKTFFGSCQGLQAYLEILNIKSWKFRSPYHFVFHYQDELVKQAEQGTGNGENTEFQIFADYLLQQSKSEREEALEMFAEGRVDARFIPYLFKPFTQLVFREEGEPIGKTQTTVVKNLGNVPADTTQWSMNVTTYQFSGSFRAIQGNAQLSHPSHESWTKRITDLSFYPLKYASAATRDMMLERGRTFFKYCQQHYVTCPAEQIKSPTSTGRPRDEQIFDQHQTQVRYMIDGEAYRIIHEDEKHMNGMMAINPEVVGDENDEAFLCQLPAFVNGFHMIDKKWVKLSVQNVKSVPWNKEAFENLAVSKETKELIKALIMNKLEISEGVDFVQGKGSGLIILLHGGPGTGKTLTAESVAEIAEKPLYRVSCGDVGTEPAHVEDYLMSVFYLGRRWESVVLLDEADVFLEQRSLDNLQRNALVSVFLRMIEYYDGILVLTSNRVGIFDEAFKSRIQLSLHYPSLDRDQRETIWRNFLGRLTMLNERMDPNIQDHVKLLAGYEMNGRQIRNAITSARQLSRFKNVPLNASSLEHVVKVGHKFETYLDDLRGGASAEDWAKEEGIR